MKEFFRITAALLGSAMLLGAMPVQAVYESPEEIAFSLRPMADSAHAYEIIGNRVTIPYEDAAAGTDVHFGIFIEAEEAELAFIRLELLSDSSSITLHDAADIYEKSEEAQTYALPDGTSFTTQYAHPYCLAKCNSFGDYLPSAMTMNANLETPGTGIFVWQGGTENTTSFLGGVSDYFSFVEFDVNIAPGTAPGTYHLDFLAEAEDGKSKPSYITSILEKEDNKIGYSDLVPTLKGAEIVVQAEDAQLRGDVDNDGKVNASDAADVLCAAAMYGATGSYGSLTDTQLAAADVDENAVVNASDGAYILQYAASKGAGNDPEWGKLIK